MNAKGGNLLASIFHGFLVDFQSQVGAKLGSKIDKKQIQKNTLKIIVNNKPLGAVLKASWRSKRCEEARKDPGGR